MSVVQPSGVSPRVPGARETHAAAGDDGASFSSLFSQNQDISSCVTRGREADTGLFVI